MSKCSIHCNTAHFLTFSILLFPTPSINFEVPLPTLKNLIVTLKTFSNDIQGAIQEIADINVELEYPERVRIDNIEQVSLLEPDD